MTPSQLKTYRILTPLLGEYLAWQLAKYLPADVADKLALRLRQIISESELRGALSAYDRST